ncbi:protein of unknown function [Ralstonia solanacearum CMR15]|nr:protein of unknown function [Ralstonia solanacearum CMR15]
MVTLPSLLQKPAQAAILAKQQTFHFILSF